MSICLLCGAHVTAHSSRCPSCGSESFTPDTPSATVAPLSFTGVKKRFRRKAHGKTIAGVCAAIAERFDVPVKAVRIAFVIGGVCPPFMAIVLPLYLALAILTPLDDENIVASSMRNSVPPSNNVISASTSMHVFRVESIESVASGTASSPSATEEPVQGAVDIAVIESISEPHRNEVPHVHAQTEDPTDVQRRIDAYVEHTQGRLNWTPLIAFVGVALVVAVVVFAVTERSSRQKQLQIQQRNAGIYEEDFGDYHVRTDSTSGFEISKNGQSLYRMTGDLFGVYRGWSSGSITPNTDINGDGEPELVMIQNRYSQKSCCYYHVFRLGNQFAYLGGFDAGAESMAEVPFRDVNHDGALEAVVKDVSFAGYLNRADLPEVVLAFRDGAYRVAPSLMLTTAPSASDLQNLIAAQKEKFDCSGEPPYEYKRQIVQWLFWQNDAAAASFADNAWNPACPGKKAFLEQLQTQLGKSPYWTEVQNATPTPDRLAFAKVVATSGDTSTTIERRFKELPITSIPSGAKILVCGSDSGLSTPAETVKVPASGCNVTVHKSGYRDAVLWVDEYVGSVNVMLRPE